ncbi:MAG: hypothetical protein PHV13_02410 [Candidatus ainarchaeum sp.]|nr:hypothetical protein [Candidatus ainarchaeum sp.]
MAEKTLEPKKDTVTYETRADAVMLQRLTSLTGSEATARKLVADVQKFNAAYAEGKLTGDGWKAAVADLANKAIPDDNAGRVRLHKAIFKLAPLTLSKDPSRMAHNVVPLKADKVQNAVKAIDFRYEVGYAEWSKKTARLFQGPASNMGEAQKASELAPAKTDELAATIPKKRAQKKD